MRSCASLSRSNLLLVPLDRKDEQFRYHALLRQMLEGELNRLGEQAAQDLHSRAAHWYTEHGDVDRAVNHAIRSGRVDQAGDLIWAHTGPYVAGGREATIRRWIESFPEERVRSTPTLALARATTYLSHGNGGQVEHWTALAQGSLGGLDAPQRMEIEVAATMLRATAVPRHGIRQNGRGDAWRECPGAGREPLEINVLHGRGCRAPVQRGAGCGSAAARGGRPPGRRGSAGGGGAVSRPARPARARPRRRGPRQRACVPCVEAGRTGSVSKTRPVRPSSSPHRRW